MLKYNLLLIASYILAFSQGTYGQYCYNKLTLTYNPNVMEQVGDFIYKGSPSDGGRRTGNTNKILIIDKDNLGFSNPIKICGEQQPNSQYVNKCASVPSYDRKLIFMQVREQDGTNIPCYSRDFVYVDIIDTRFSLVRLPNCGGFEFTNASVPFTAITANASPLNLNFSSIKDTVQGYDNFPNSIEGFDIPVTYYKSIADYQTYEFVITDLTTNKVTVYPSYVGHKFTIPNAELNVELRIKGIEGKLNHVSRVFKVVLRKTITRKACGSFTISNTVYDKSGTYEYTKQNASGCDSTITINLTIIAASSNTININTCESSYTLNNQSYINSGTFTQTIKNKAGCDSTIILNLKVNNSTTSTINQTTCGNFTLNGQTYINSGTFTQTLKNKAGCDSTITLNLKINKPTSSIINQVPCNSSITINGVAYTTGGTYTQTLKNKAGCDSTITINLTFIKINTEVKSTTTDLTAVETNAMYKWFECSTPAIILKNSDSPIYSPAMSGGYGVTITKTGCSATSTCVTFTNPLATEASDQTQNITISPNPTNGIVTLTFGQIEQETTVYLVSALGQTVSRTQVENAPSVKVDLQNFPSGMYYILVYRKDKKTQSFTVVRE